MKVLLAGFFCLLPFVSGCSPSSRDTQNAQAASAPAPVVIDAVKVETRELQRPVEAVTGNCYELLDVTPSIGRLFTTDDVPIAGEPGHVALVSDRVWRQEFGASTDVLGRSLRVEGTPITIIGVLPMSYHGLSSTTAAIFSFFCAMTGT